MKIVIELIGDDGKPFSQEAGRELIGIMLRDLPEDNDVANYGCLELCDFEGRAVLARVVGAGNPAYDALLPYIAPPLEAGP